MANEHPDIVAAVKGQVEAADPSGSRLASANAGSGKTKVLVDRVTRLLLGETPPDKILCLTYTKAAANEMQNRLFKTLGQWSVLPEEKLNQELNEVFGKPKQRDKESLNHARRLFAKALETPEGLKVQTIHAFCERILGRFPIEAGIQPGFDPIDDADMKEIRKNIETDIYREAYAFPEGSLAQAVKTLASERADQTVEKLMQWSAGHVDEIKGWQRDGLAPLQNRLKLGNDASIESIKVMAWQVAQNDIRVAAKGLLKSQNTNDVLKGHDLLKVVEIDDPLTAFEAYMAMLTTAKGDVRASYTTIKAPEFVQNFFGRAKGEQGTEIARLLDVQDHLKRAKVFNLTRAIFEMSSRFVHGYEREKLQRRGLDFNDQISLVRDLLSHSEYAAWVLYKLDYGVHHILVDEAQDTAPSQWSIIDAIKDGFDADDPNDLAQEVKTFFAVGDEKQSIYSFQGARPEQFMQRVRDAETIEAKTVRMEMSFRSAPEILRCVDAVFDDCGAQDKMFDQAVLKTVTSRVSHSAKRVDAGLVELWPLAPKPEKGDEEEAWNTKPVDRLSDASAREQLAAAIADQIKTWLDAGEPVYDRDNETTRPMRADDILILVRGRNDFFDGVIRNLKSRDIPVAGADRLIVSEALIVQDMLALTRFVLLPQDDLSLAEVLKGPLFGFDDEDIFKLCYGRKGAAVWSCLRESLDPKFRDAADRLADIIKYSRQYAPFEFYRRVLDMTDANGTSHLKLVYGRLSLEAQDALEAFLNKALAHQRQGAPSLQHFLKAMSTDKQDIKREMDNAQGEVRVMTVHGAKGLQAPVVILPDTTQTPGSRNSEQLLSFEHEDKSSLVYLPNSGGAPENLHDVLDAEKARQMQEYLRLLYVAMTRAESRLVVCGYWFANRKAGVEDGCWYKLMTDAFDVLDHESQPHFREGWGDIKTFGKPAAAATNELTKPKAEYTPLPGWALERAKPETVKIRKVTPSHLLAIGKYADVPARSPLSRPVDRFRRGNLTHKLLEVLPDMAEDRRRPAAKTFLDQHLDISDSVRRSIEDEVMAVLEHADYAPFFAAGSQAEVNLAGQGAGLPDYLRLNAQIDRLAVTDTHVYIIDYKSNRPPPDNITDVPEIYWGQMAAYREMIRLIYPDHEIMCALLWTDGPSLMTLPDEGLDVALTQINTIPT